MEPSSARSIQLDFETLAAGLPWPVFATDPGGLVGYGNPAWHAFTAASSERTCWFDLVHDGDRAGVRRLWGRATRAGRVFEHRFRLRRSDGKYFWHHARGWPVDPRSQLTGGWLMWLEDIHQATHLQATLARREREFQMLVENAPEGIARFDRRLRCKYVNGVFRAALETGGVRLVGQDLRHFPLPPDVVESWSRIVTQAFATQTLQTGELTLLASDGPRTFSIRCSPERAESMRVTSVLCVMHEMTEQQRAFAAQRASEQRLRQLTDKMDDMFWMARSAPPELLYLNPAAQRLWGVEHETLRSAPETWAEQVLPEDRPIFRDPFDFVDGEADRHYRIRRADGTVVWIRDRRFVIDAEQQLVAGIAEDVTARWERDRLREHHLVQAQQERAQAEALSSAKDQFLAVVSHELRSPLNAIRGWTHVLRQSDPGSAPFVQALSAIERNSALQLSLIEDLLDSARVVAGKLSVEPRPVFLRRVIEQAVQTVEPAALGRGVAIQVDHDPRVELVEVDPVRFEQVLSNLLSNALKFTPSGGAIDVWSRVSGKDCEIIVSDTGAGISASFLPHVFERFRQADSSSTRQQGGLGLGLFLAREIVELHGGSLSVSSEGPGRGARFTIRLPLGREGSPVRAIRGARAPGV